MSTLQLEQLGYIRTAIKPLDLDFSKIDVKVDPVKLNLNLNEPVRSTTTRTSAPVSSGSTQSSDYPATTSYTRAKILVEKLFKERYNHDPEFMTHIREAQAWTGAGSRAYSNFIQKYDRNRPVANLAPKPAVKTPVRSTTTTHRPTDRSTTTRKPSVPRPSTTVRPTTPKDAECSTCGDAKKVTATRTATPDRIRYMRPTTTPGPSTPSADVEAQKQEQAVVDAVAQQEAAEKVSSDRSTKTAVSIFASLIPVVASFAIKKFS